MFICKLEILKICLQILAHTLKPALKPVADRGTLAVLQAVCVEAGMLALRRDATEVNHEDFNEGIIQVQSKKKASLNYYA